ncbi:MAG: diaminopimelate decarboxylase [Cryomorphaceae bacterium]|jgi:diaminopimelate decarboxylase
METLNFLTPELVTNAINHVGSPAYVYSRETIEQRCAEVSAFPNAFGLNARYALKANPHLAILKIVEAMGLHFDASSEYEVMRCLHAGIPGEKIQLTSQQFPRKHLTEIIAAGVLFNACSLRQIDAFGKAFPGSNISFRVNPGTGSGSNRKTNVGGPSASFGIWHEQTDEAAEIAAKHNLSITRIHSHIGSGSDPEVWKAVTEMTLAQADKFPSVHTVNLGGGFKVARMSSEKSTDLQEVGEFVKSVFIKHAENTGNEYKLEVEPGTYLSANCGSLICDVDDISNTGADGYTFLKLNTGMDTITRPALYASEHPIIILNDSDETEDYVVCGHCCESGDVFTVDDTDTLTTRTLNKAEVGDLVVIEGAGAYCASMSLKNYNSFPTTPQILLDDGELKIIQQPQSLTEMLSPEIVPE